jgi:tRNA (cytidine/uridine-2'-O-)-methyltransferase
MGNPAPERHVVLVAPEIHWNTGNIGRTCLGMGAALHLVRPLGFSLDERRVKRAGLDYWPRVPLRVWDSYETFCEGMAPGNDMAFLSKLGKRPLWEMPRSGRLFLVFGSETRGLPQNILDPNRERSYYIPITDSIRSLNLSTAAGMALYESLRGLGPVHGREGRDRE